MSLVTYALVTVQNAKDFLGVSDNADDGRLEMYINMATDFIENYCQRRFKTGNYVDEVYSGDGSDSLVLKNYPITALTSIQKNTAYNNSSNWETVSTEDYFYDSLSGVVENIGRFTIGRNNFKITYAGGYTTIPYDLQYACMVIVEAMYRKKKSGGVISESLGDHSVTYAQYSSVVAGDPEAQAILDKYRNVASR
jgi:hypothetical protein